MTQRAKRRYQRRKKEQHQMRSHQAKVLNTSGLGSCAAIATAFDRFSERFRELRMIPLVGMSDRLSHTLQNFREREEQRSRDAFARQEIRIPRLRELPTTPPENDRPVEGAIEGFTLSQRHRNALHRWEVDQSTNTAKVSGNGWEKRFRTRSIAVNRTNHYGSYFDGAGEHNYLQNRTITVSLSLEFDNHAATVDENFNFCVIHNDERFSVFCRLTTFESCGGTYRDSWQEFSDSVVEIEMTALDWEMQVGVMIFTVRPTELRRRENSRFFENYSFPVFRPLLGADREVRKPRHRPPVCNGCSYYHEPAYIGDETICGVHPSGYNGDVCPDWEADS
jgi:hypothetical protein